MMTPVVEMVQVRMLKFRLVRRLEVWPGPASPAADPGQRIFADFRPTVASIFSAELQFRSASASWLCAKCPQPTSSFASREWFFDLHPRQPSRKSDTNLLLGSCENEPFLHGCMFLGGASCS